MGSYAGEADGLHPHQYGKGSVHLLYPRMLFDQGAPIDLIVLEPLPGTGSMVNAGANLNHFIQVYLRYGLVSEPQENG